MRSSEGCFWGRSGAINVTKRLGTAAMGVRA